MATQRTTVIPASGAVVQEITNSFSYLYFRAVTADNEAQYSFDGQQWFAVMLNDFLGPIPTNPTRIYFRAIGGLDVSVTFTFDSKPFVSSSVDSRTMSTRSVGTYFSLATVGGTIVGMNNGNRRKSIYFSMTSPSPASVGVRDPSGTLCAIITQLSPYREETDSTFIVGILTGLPDLAVNEIYYNQ
jgi:hypothetical protein